MEWGAIFYYANETKLLPEQETIKEKMQEFMSVHQISTTFYNFKSKYYQAVKRINKIDDYPIDKLKKIIPFLRKNYKETVGKVSNDIEILNSKKDDY